MIKKKMLRILCPVIVVIILLTVTFSLLGTLLFNRFSRGIVPTAAAVQAIQESGQTYDHVVIFGVDGAGGYFNEMDTPGFDSVFYSEAMDASVTFTAVSQFPTDSAQNWGSLLHGVRCGKHKLTNGLAGEQKYTDEKYPSLFKVYSERHPDVYMASVVDWSVINFGIIEDNIKGMVKINAGDLVSEQTQGLSWMESEKIIDAAVAEEAIRQIETQDPTILFTHFDCVDAAGHNFGTGSSEYIGAMRYVDELIGKIYQACLAHGWGENTLFICVSDHGHKYSGGHGTNDAIVRHTTFAVAGAKGNVINGTPGYTVTQDMAAVVFYALGETQYGTWDGSVPKNMFKGL